MNTPPPPGYLGTLMSGKYWTKGNKASRKEWDFLTQIRLINQMDPIGRLIGMRRRKIGKENPKRNTHL